MEVKEKSPCYGCEERHPRCHGTCVKYAGFLDEKNENWRKRIESENASIPYAAYARDKRVNQNDRAAKKGWRTPSYRKARYK